MGLGVEEFFKSNERKAPKIFDILGGPLAEQIFSDPSLRESRAFGKRLPFPSDDLYSITVEKRIVTTWSEGRKPIAYRIELTERESGAERPLKVTVAPDGKVILVLDERRIKLVDQEGREVAIKSWKYIHREEQREYLLPEPAGRVTLIDEDITEMKNAGSSITITKKDGKTYRSISGKDGDFKFYDYDPTRTGLGLDNIIERPVSEEEKLILEEARQKYLGTLDPSLQRLFEREF